MRLNYREVAPDALKAMLGVEAVANRGLDDPRLLDLVKIRASQINGCAYCLALHAAEAREHGETDERLDMVAVWREADCFSRAERAAEVVPSGVELEVAVLPPSSAAVGSV
jgi:AhpD family alkylhydroperoxidase